MPIKVALGDPRARQRLVEADRIALDVFAIAMEAIAAISDDPTERIQLLNSTVWTLVGRFLSAWDRKARQLVWDDYEAVVMGVAEDVRRIREGEGRVQ